MLQSPYKFTTILRIVHVAGVKKLMINFFSTINFPKDNIERADDGRNICEHMLV